MENIPSQLIITVKSYIDITSFKMKGSPDLGQAVVTVAIIKPNSRQSRLIKVFIKIIQST